MTALRAVPEPPTVLRRPKVYIAGQYTGVDERVALQRFEEAYEFLTGLGFDAYNPVEVKVEGWAWAEYLKHDLKILFDCDAIYLLKGWHNSKGACLERMNAIELGLLVVYQDPTDQNL